MYRSTLVKTKNFVTQKPACADVAQQVEHFLAN